MPANEALVNRWNALGPDIGVLVQPLVDDPDASPLISLNPDLTLEMGSVFKVFVLAAFARLVERGEASWEQTFRLTSSVRIPHSAVLETMPDGAAISAHDLLVAMMGPSDNTATVMLMASLTDGALDQTIGLAGLGSTTVAPDLRPLYALGEADPMAELRCCRTTVSDMVRFYRFALSGRMLTDPGVDSTFRDILRSEDRDQGTNWGSGLSCLRKSGFVAPPPVLGLGFAGAMFGGVMPLVFAFALNRRTDEAGGRPLADAFGPTLLDTLLWAIEPA